MLHCSLLLGPHEDANDSAANICADLSEPRNDNLNSNFGRQAWARGRGGGGSEKDMRKPNKRLLIKSLSRY